MQARPGAAPLSVLLIGGGGFVSGTMCRTALAAGHRVWAITRSARNLPAEAVALVADRQDVAAMAAVLTGCGMRWDLIIDCIGYQAADARQDIGLVPRFADHLVFISTDAVFDYRSPEYMKDETFAQFAREGYGRGKRDCEEIFESAPPDIRWTILRPSHVYGPGSEFGCVPLHLRDQDLLTRMRNGEELALVANGFLLQQPVLARDLAAMALSCHGNAAALRHIFMAVGPDIVEARRYYQLLGERIGKAARIREASVEAFAASNSPYYFTIGHRVYSMAKAHRANLDVPRTPIGVALDEHIQWALAGGR
jgi:nucleoside-diphosphate-sugar epimerase